MSNTKVYGDVVATVGEYKDKDGNEKKRFLRVGTAFVTEGDDGNRSMSIKMDALPLSADWSRWLRIYQRKSKREQEEEQYRQQQEAHVEPVDDNIDEPIDLSDIPF